MNTNTNITNKVREACEKVNKAGNYSGEGRDNDPYVYWIMTGFDHDGEAVSLQETLDEMEWIELPHVASDFTMAIWQAWIDLREALREMLNNPIEDAIEIDIDEASTFTRHNTATAGSGQIDIDPVAKAGIAVQVGDKWLNLDIECVPAAFLKKRGAKVPAGATHLYRVDHYRSLPTWTKYNPDEKHDDDWKPVAPEVLNRVVFSGMISVDIENDYGDSGTYWHAA